MTSPSPRRFPPDKVAALAREIVDACDGEVRLALPLGLGKANSIANALVRLAADDPSIRLSILTALTLQPPRPGPELQRRFLGPARERLFGDYPPLRYAELLDSGELPANIAVSEFFLQAGVWLGNSAAQRHHISANYSQALGYLRAFRPNVVAQLVATDADGRISLSCNTDITADLLKLRREGEIAFLMAVEENRNLPFMEAGAALMDRAEADLYLSSPDSGFELFSAVRRPVSPQDMAIGLHVARLVRDGGTLQIGIGSIGDAIAHALILRDTRNAAFLEMIDASPFASDPPEDNRAPFEEGLYSVTEMLVGGLLELFDAGIIRREVEGAAIHAGFFVECRDFYRRLREMEPARRRKIAMMPISFTNTLAQDAEARRAARRDARFVNNAMIATALGAVVSDGLEDGRVVSGVGGQFDFVTQAFALDGARSVITLNATRRSGGKVQSNIRWSYGHETIPRHLRDIIVTEYGCADLRGQSDEDCVKRMLAICDSRFQDNLLEEARKAGKIAADFRIPDAWRTNTPRALRHWLREGPHPDMMAEFPFGTDFSEVERRLLTVLDDLQHRAASVRTLPGLLWKGLRAGPTGKAECALLDRLGLLDPAGLRDRLYRRLVLGAMRESAGDGT